MFVGFVLAIYQMIYLSSPEEGRRNVKTVDWTPETANALKTAYARAPGMYGFCSGAPGQVGAE